MVLDPCKEGEVGGLAGLVWSSVHGPDHLPPGEGVHPDIPAAGDCARNRPDDLDFCRPFLVRLFYAFHAGLMAEECRHTGKGILLFHDIPDKLHEEVWDQRITPDFCDPEYLLVRYFHNSNLFHMSQ